MTPPDRTYLAVRRQLDGFDADDYEVGVRTPLGQMVKRRGDAASVLRLVPWLKKQNADGCDIYIRPASTVDGCEVNAGLILLDDLDAQALKLLDKLKFTPSAIVETSPGNYQAWVRFSDEPVEPRCATEIAKLMAETVRADPNSADWRHFGRLAGYTNRKPKHADAAGNYPWALCHTARPHVSVAGRGLYRAISELLEEQAFDVPAAPTLAAPADQSGSLDLAHDIKAALHKKHAQIDHSRVDFSVAKELIRSGYDDATVIDTLRQVSTDLVTRKAGHVDDYLARTASKARQAVLDQLL